MKGQVWPKSCGLFTSNLEELDLLWYGKKREGSFPEEVPLLIKRYVQKDGGDRSKRRCHWKKFKKASLDRGKMDQGKLARNETGKMLTVAKSCRSW